MAEPELLGKRVRCKKCGSSIGLPDFQNAANEKDQQMTIELETIREELNEFKHDIENLDNVLSTHRFQEENQKKEN